MSNPLYVLAKIGISAVPNKTLESKRDDLHEALRREYPTVGPENNQQQHSIELTPDGHKVSVESTPLLSMTNPGTGWGVRILPSAIFLHATSYESYADFARRLEHLLGLVHEIIEITHYQFAGLRYVNKYELVDGGFGAIKRQEFLQPDLGLPPAGSNLQAVYFTEGNQLNVNSGITVNNPPMSPDLMELAKDLGMSFEPLMGPHAHLDLDAHCQLQVPESFELKKVLAKVDELRQLAKGAYLQVAG